MASDTGSAAAAAGAAGDSTTGGGRGAVRIAVPVDPVGGEPARRGEPEVPDEPLPPLPNASPALALPGLVAGFVRALAANAGAVMVGAGKGVLRWWFRVPVKLFRPYAVNPWLVFRSLAASQDKAFSIQFLRETIRAEGIGFFGRNAVPLFVANAVVGATLFNVYAVVFERLSAESAAAKHGGSGSGSGSGGSGSDKGIAGEAAAAFPNAFVAGGVAGAAQALLATPLDTIQRMLEPEGLVASRHVGVHHATRQALREALPAGFVGRARALYGNLAFNVARDGAGFALFFGAFEGLRHAGHGAVARAVGADGGRESRTPVHVAGNAVVTVAAGAAAGAAFQLAAFPLERMAAEMAAGAGPAGSETGAGAGAGRRRPPRVTMGGAWRLVRTHGIWRYYAGIGPQLARAMPPGAAALLVYELLAA